MHRSLGLEWSAILESACLQFWKMQRPVGLESMEVYGFGKHRGLQEFGGLQF